MQWVGESGRFGWSGTQQRCARALAQLLQQGQDLCLHRDIERSRGLIGEHQLRLGDQCHCDHHALAHAARQLVRILARAALGLADVHRLEHLERTLPRGAARQAGMDPWHLTELIDHTHVRVERRHGILEDHRDARAADAVQACGGKPQQLVLVEADAAADACALGQQPQHGQQHRGLARTGFANDADALARRDLQIHATHGIDGATRGGIAHGQLPDLKHWLGCGVHACPRGSSRSRNPSPRKLKQ